MRLVLLGPPGAGKGTQAVHLARAADVPHIPTGDIFREHVRNDTTLGRAARSHMERGGLVPDEIVVGMVTDRISAPDTDGGFVLDGFPRTVPQAQTLERFLEQAGRPLDAVLRFSLSEDEAIRRIVARRICPVDGSVYHLIYAPPRMANQCDHCTAELVHRRDDTVAVVERRLEEYRQKTLPLEAFYAVLTILVDVNAEGDVDEVTRRALAVLERLDSGGKIRVDRNIDLTDAPAVRTITSSRSRRHAGHRL